MSKQKILEVLKTGINAGPPPSFPQIDLAYASQCAGKRVGEAFLDPAVHAYCLESALRRHSGAAGVYINLCLNAGSIASLDCSNPGHTYAVDLAGVRWSIPENDVGSPCRYDIADLDDTRLLTVDALSGGITETFAKISDACRHQYLIVPGITGPYSQVVFMFGLQNTLESIYDAPEKLHEILAVRTRFAINWAKKLKELGAECVWIGEGAASSSLISPQHYAQFVMPYAKALVNEIRALGMYSIMHVCGNINPSFAHVAETGADAMDIDHMVSLVALCEGLPRRTCLKGNMDPVHLLTCTPEQVAGESRSIADSVKGKCGFILSTGCLIPRDADPACVDAMIGFAG